MADIYTEIDAQGHRRDIVDPDSQRWINEFLRITGISRLKAAQVWSSVGKQMTPLEAAVQLGYNASGPPPEDAAEQSNKQPPVSTEGQWQREAASPPFWQADIIDELIERGPAGERYTRSDDEAVVHDFGIASNTAIGKAGKKSATWRVLEFLRDTRDFAHMRIRGEFDRIEDAREFLLLLRSNEVLDALSGDASADPRE